MGKRLSEPEATWPTYHEALGEAIAAWADLENNLGHWFCAIAALAAPQGLAIFYSGRNFGTRADMIEAALPHSQLGSEDTELVAAVMKVAHRYSGFRNAIAHDRHVQFFGGEIYASKGDDVSREIMLGRAKTISDIRQATANIKRLTELLLGPDLWAEAERGWQTRHLAQVRQLPTLAHSSEPTPIPEPKRPPRRS